MKKCPIKRFEEKLIKEKVLNKNKMKHIREEIGKKIEGAVAFANQSPFPDPQDIFEDVYVSSS
jgi:pyruvate dehydrogenase E1 component alpha subunit